MISRILRRTHMYLALFLTPWVLMYTLSTMSMNHRGLFRELYGAGPPAFEKESELSWNGSFSDGASRTVQARTILASAGLEGAFNLEKSAPGSLVIQRHDPVHPRRLTYTPADGRIVVEKQIFRTNALLERLHRRRGFQYPYVADDGWAATVDLFVVAMVFWALSGLWMWWEMKATRKWGAVAALSGLALFLFFLVSI